MPKFFWTANLEIITLLCNSHYCSIWITPYNIHVYLEDLMYWGDKWCVQGYTRSLRWKKAWLCLWASLASAVATGLDPSHWSFDSSYGIIYSLGSWRNFSVAEQAIHLIVFIHPEDVACAFAVLHSDPWFLCSSTMLWTTCCLPLKYLCVLFAVFCLPSVFLWTFWSVNILSIHRNGERRGDAGLGASLLGEFWLTALFTWMDICGKNYTKISPKLHPYW